MEVTENTPLNVPRLSCRELRRHLLHFSAPELLVSRDVPEVGVTDPGLRDRASPHVKLDAEDVSIANL